MNELPPDRISIVTVLGTLAATIGALMMLRSVVTRGDLVQPQWARYAKALAGAFVLIWSGGTLFLLLRGSSIPSNVASIVMLLKSVVGGMGAGVIITLFMSGSLRRRSSRLIDGPEGSVRK